MDFGRNYLNEDQRKSFLCSMRTKCKTQKQHKTSNAKHKFQRNKKCVCVLRFVLSEDPHENYIEILFNREHFCYFKNSRNNCFKNLAFVLQS